MPSRLRISLIEKLAGFSHWYDCPSYEPEIRAALHTFLDLLSLFSPHDVPLTPDKMISDVWAEIAIAAPRMGRNEASICAWWEGEIGL